MKAFYVFMLYCTQLELAIAKVAPVRNANYVADLKRDEMKWERELRLWEINHVAS